MYKADEQFVTELNRRYSIYLSKHKNRPRFNRGEKNPYLKILETLYSEDGKDSGYTDVSSFKSNIIRCKYNMKKARTAERTIKADVTSEHDSEEEFWETAHMKPEYHPREGDGEIYTMDQINRYNLNPESY